MLDELEVGHTVLVTGDKVFAADIPGAELGLSTTAGAADLDMGWDGGGIIAGTDCIDGLSDGVLAMVCECADVLGGTCVGIEAGHTLPWRPDKCLDVCVNSDMVLPGVIYLVALTIAWLIDKFSCRLADPERFANRACPAPVKRPD